MKGRRMLLSAALCLLPLICSSDTYPIDLICNIKIGAIEFGFKNREEYTLNQTISKLEDEYEQNHKDNLRFVTFLDTQRILIDIYRKNRDGSFRIPNNKEVIAAFATVEYQTCYKNGY